MLTARDEKGRRISVFNADGSRNFIGYCPCCGKEMVARAGKFRRPHWAHRSVERCDEWWEEESAWHLKWRKLFDCDSSMAIDIENVLEKDGQRHFYDIRLNDSLSIILRRKKLTPEQVAQREGFFGDMIWIIGASQSEYHRFEKISKGFAESEIIKDCCYCCQENINGFWSRWSECCRPVVFDFGDFSKDDVVWAVLPRRKGVYKRYLIKLSKEDLVNKRLLKSGKLFNIPLASVYEEIEKRIESSKKQVPKKQVTFCCRPQMNSSVDHACENNVKLRIDRGADIFAGNTALSDYWNKKRL